MFRPLVAGIAVQNPKVGRLGTIGFFGTSDGNDRWLVSCYHVLCRIDADFPAGAVEPIHQPFFEMAQVPIAWIDGSRADRDLDVAAALVSGASVVTRVLGLPSLKAPIEPKVGMRVIKSGITTGVTEGQIAHVSDREIRIVIPQGYPSTFEISEAGDSGALWIDAETSSPVGLHFQGVESGAEMAFARPITRVLDRLSLTVL